MKTKRIIALILAMTMMAAVTGCTKSEEKTSSTTTPSDTASKAPEVPVVLSKTEQAKADLDFGGETITFAFPPGYGLVNNPENPAASLTRRDDKLKELETKYNVKFVVKEGAGTYWDNMATSIAAGSPEGHIMLTQVKQQMAWAGAGAVSDLTAAMEKTGIDFMDTEKYSQVVRRYSNYNNQQLAFSEPAPYVGGTYWFFNKRIFEEMQLGDPYKMIADKEWNWDKVTELAKKATKKNADGSFAQYGLGTMAHMDLLLSLAQSNGTNIAQYDASGNPELSIASPAGMKAFNQMSKWLFEDKVSLFNNGSLNWDITLKDFVAGKVAIFCGRNSVLNEAKGTPMADDFGVLYAPMGPDVTEYKTGATASQFYFIPKTYEGMADKLLLVIDDLYALPDGMKRADTVSESYISHMRDEQSLTNYADMALNYDANLYDITASSGLDFVPEPGIGIMAACTAVTDGTATPGDIIEKNKTQMLKIMQDALSTMKLTGK